MNSEVSRGFKIGIGIGAGVATTAAALLAVLTAWDAATGSGPVWQEVDSPPEVKIADYREIPGAAHLTFEGTLVNEGDRLWHRVSVLVTVRGAGITTECRQDAYGVQPAAQHQFKVECHDVSSVPAVGRTYEIAVPHGYLARR
jgi:hypothetical protein